MANPTLELDWTVLSNLSTQNEGTELAMNKAIMLGVKQALTHASLPLSWSVELSSNGVSAGVADYWSSVSDIVWGTSTRSWIVFGVAGWDEGDYQLCIDLNKSTSSSEYIGVVLSPANGFSGGSISARPTASDEIVIDSNLLWTIANAQNYDGVIHVQQSLDGEQTRLLAMGQHGVAMSVWWFDVPKNPKDGWTDPKVMNILPYSAFEYDRTGGNNDNIFNCLASDAGLRHNYNGSNFAAADAIGLLAPHNDGTQLIEYDSSPSQNSGGNYNAWPMLMGNADEGKLCELYDCYATNRQTVAYAPSDGSNDFICLRNIVLPWDGASEMTTTASPVTDIDLDVVEIYGAQAAPAIAKDSTAPVLSSFSPAPGELTSRHTPVTFSVTDLDPGLLRVIVTIKYTSQSGTMLVYDGVQFLSPFDSDQASVVAISNGVEITLLPVGGWVANFEIFVKAIDSDGNLVGALTA